MNARALTLSFFLFLLLGMPDGNPALLVSPPQTETVSARIAGEQPMTSPAPAVLNPRKLKLDWKFGHTADGRYTGETRSFVSPALSEGKLYAGRIVGIQSQQFAPMQFQGYVFCLNAVTGEQIWETKVEGEEQIRLSVDQAGNRLYCLTNEYVEKANKIRVACLDKNTGEVIWNIERDGRVYGISTPIVSEKTLCIEIRSTEDKQEFYGIDKTGGKELWTFKTGSTSGDDTTVLHDKRLYSTTRSGQESNVHCLDIDTGRLIWKYEIQGYLGCPGCSASDRRIFIATRPIDNKQNATYVHCLDSETGALIWKTEISVPFVSFLPVVSGNRLFIAGRAQFPIGAIFCLDASNGKHQWKFETDENAVPESSPAVFEDRVYLYAESGGGTAQSTTGYLYCLDKQSGNLVWRYVTKGGTFVSQPVASGSYLYWSGTIGQNRIGYIHCFDRNTGERIRRLRTGRPIASRPMISEGTVIVGAGDEFYAFKEGDVVTGRIGIVFVFVGILLQGFFGLFQESIHKRLDRKGRGPAFKRRERYRRRLSHMERMFDKANRIARSLSGGSGLLVINVYFGWVLMFLVFLMPVSVAYFFLVIIPLDPWLPKWWPFAAYGFNAAIIAALIFLV